MLKLLWEQWSLTKRVYGEYMQPVCEKYGLTRMELNVLLFLANNPQYDTAKDMVEIRGFTKSHVSAAVKALEEKRYLEKWFQPGNRKTTHLCVNAEAKVVVSAGQEAQRNFFEVLSAGISAQEIQQQISFMEKVNVNLRHVSKEE